MANSACWNELAEFERCTPSELAFRALVGLLDTWPGADQAAAIEHADRLLSTWPDAERTAPWSWCQAAAKGTVLPTWRLVRALELKSGHLGKGDVNLARLARHASLARITELILPIYSDYYEVSFLYHRPETFPALKTLRASDRFDGADARALANSPLWQTLESFGIEVLGSSLAHNDTSRIVPQFERTDRIRHLRLRSLDLIEVWEQYSLPNLEHVEVFIRSIEEAEMLAARPELSQLKSLSIAFRCGFSGSSPWEPFLGNIIEADEAAAETYFGNADLGQLEELTLVGHTAGYWGREGLGRLGLEALMASGLLKRLKRLRLELLPLGDKGVTALAPALGIQLEKLELVNVYCKGEGAAALSESPCLSSLRHLDLSGNRIGAHNISQLAQANIPHLESLDLSGPGINPYYWNIGEQPLLDQGAAAWANSPNVKQLKSLKLANCHLTDAGLAAIFQSPQLQKLEHLDLAHNSFSAAAIAQTVVGSPLWRTLRDLGLDHCRLDNDAIEALTKITDAPALRCLTLSYNSISPRGATALANWPALANVWHLQLHDNLIGDEGLIALARSPYVGRLLELDLEQDCWNSRAFNFHDEAARAFASSGRLTRLDAIYSGCIDEYHGAAYSPGFSKTGLDLVRKSAWARPAFRAACSDFSDISDYFDSPPFNEQAPLGDGDFRGGTYTLNEKEAEGTVHNMRQIRSPAWRDPFDPALPPKVLESLPELEDDDEDAIAGIGSRDPKPVIDTTHTFRLSLDDKAHPLPNQVGKVVSDTLGSIFQATGVGYLSVGGGSSRQGEDGRSIPIDTTFHVGLKANPESALHLVRETMWWLGAPEQTVLDKFPLDLGTKPAHAASHFLQMASLEIVRWSFDGEPGYRLDRLPFTNEQRQAVHQCISTRGSPPATDGWSEITTQDSGRMKLHTKYLNDAAEFDTLNILVEQLSRDITAILNGLLDQCQFMLLPMFIAPNAEFAATLDCDWPKVEVVASTTKLHNLLARGPYDWWKRLGNEKGEGEIK